MNLSGLVRGSEDAACQVIDGDIKEAAVSWELLLRREKKRIESRCDRRVTHVFTPVVT